MHKDFWLRLWFEMVTPPLRPSYQARHMRPDFIAADERFRLLRDAQFESWRAERHRPRHGESSLTH